jgi:RNA polymerase sigma-70 factor (ECF subfamily)
VQPAPRNSHAPGFGAEGEALPKEHADAELALRLRSDPTRATVDLYARFSAEVNRLVWRLLGADPDHNDIVQQVFCKVIQHGRKLREPSRLGAWVQSITVNTVYEELRRRDVRRLFQRDSGTVEFHPDLVRDVEVRDLLLRAKRVIERLPAKERLVFMLHFVEGRPLGEVAELCGFSLATAKRRLNAANRRFEALISRNTDLLSLLKRREEERDQ